MPTRAGARKLTLNVSFAVGARLDEMAERKGITVTELMRRAVALQDIVDRATEEYGDLMIVRAKNPDDVVHQLSSLL